MAQGSGRLDAAGIGVTDLERSAAFYCTVFGLEEMMRFELPTMDEIIVGRPGKGAAIVLMCHTDGVERDLANTGGKLVFGVRDAAATAALACEHGASMVMEPAPATGMGGAVVGFVADPDGHTIELLQR